MCQNSVFMYDLAIVHWFIQSHTNIMNLKFYSIRYFNATNVCALFQDI